VNMETLSLSPSAPPRSVTVVGAGNIGSHLLPLLARLPALGRVTIVDYAFYDEPKNLVSQAITPADLGQPKAVVQAMRLREINPRLRVTPLVARLENVPWGALRADVLVGCLDSRRARRLLSRLAFRLGVPLVDAGVQADGLLARIHVFRPGEESPCVECSWDERDYETEGEAFSCDGTPVEPAPTNSPACLGALAAAMQAIEVSKILVGAWDQVASGREVLIDARSHRHCVSRLIRSPSCRWDHRTFQVREVRAAPSALALGDLFALGISDLRVEGQVFARQWACAGCQAAREVFGLRDRLSVPCPVCGQGMRALGFHTVGTLTMADIPEGLSSTPLATLGFSSGDIFSGSIGAEEVHFELNTQPLSHS